MMKQNMKMRTLQFSDIVGQLGVPREAWIPSIEEMALEYEAPTPESLLALFQERNMTGVVGTVSTPSGNEWPVAYAMYQKQRKALVLRRITVHPFYQKEGCARDILEWLQVKLPRRDRHWLLCVVPESQMRHAIMLEKCGFSHSRLLRRPYEKEDKILMGYSPSCVKPQFQLVSEEEYEGTAV